MRVHASNFRDHRLHRAAVASPTSPRLAHEHGLLLLDDLGTGCLLDTTRVRPAAGADAAGERRGRRRPRALLRRQAARRTAGGHHRRPRRAHRAAAPPPAGARGAHGQGHASPPSTATLLHYLRGEALEKVPVWRMIATPLHGALAAPRPPLGARDRPRSPTSSTARSMIGGGSLPEESLPTKALAISGDGAFATSLAHRLRTATTPIVGRIEDGALLLDPRTVDPRDDRALVAAVKAATTP